MGGSGGGCAGTYREIRRFGGGLVAVVEELTEKAEVDETEISRKVCLRESVQRT